MVVIADCVLKVYLILFCVMYGCIFQWNHSQWGFFVCFFPIQHHHLALAAEGLAWDGDESHFSGFLGGEENPDNLEVSIGTYIAARTETLGTLTGDPNIPRVRIVCRDLPSVCLEECGTK